MLISIQVKGQFPLDTHIRTQTNIEREWTRHISIPPLRRFIPQMISNELLLLGLAPGPEPFPVNPGDGANKRRRGTGLVAAFPIPRRSGSEPPSSFLRFVFFFFRRLLIAPGTLVVPGGRTVPFGVMRRDSTDTGRKDRSVRCHEKRFD